MFLYKIHNVPQDLNLGTKENVSPDPTFPTFFHVWITLQKLNSLFRVDKRKSSNVLLPTLFNVNNIVQH